MNGQLGAVRRDAPRAPVIQGRPASRRTSTDRGETEPVAGASGGITRCGRQWGITRCGRQWGHHSLRAPVGASLVAGASGGITRCGREWGHHSLRAPVGASLAAGASGGITRCGREWGQRYQAGSQVSPVSQLMCRSEICWLVICNKPKVIGS
jgi:hypothetical protein